MGPASPVEEKETYRPLTEYEEACKVNYTELDDRLDRYLVSTSDRLISDVKDIEKNILNQVQRHGILVKRKHSLISKVTVNTGKFKANFLNSMVFHYFEGKQDARKAIENSLGKRLRFTYADVELTPTEALDRFGKRAVVSKAEFSRMAARERTRSFTVAGVLESDMLSTARNGLIKAVDESWSLSEFGKYLKDANVKYTGTVYGTAKKQGQPLTPYHLDTILRTNISEIYNGGRWEMMNHPDVVDFVPAYQYSAVLDNRVRPEHERMDGRVYVRDDPIWQDWLPPNGYRCRCTVWPVTSNRPFTVSTPVPATLTPDPGFARGIAA